MIYHEKDDSQDLLGHLDLISVVKSHDSFLFYQVFLTEVFHSIEGARDVLFSTLEWID